MIDGSDKDTWLPPNNFCQEWIEDIWQISTKWVQIHNIAYAIQNLMYRKETYKKHSMKRLPKFTQQTGIIVNISINYSSFDILNYIWHTATFKMNFKSQISFGTCLFMFLFCCFQFKCRYWLGTKCGFKDWETNLSYIRTANPAFHSTTDSD